MGNNCFAQRKFRVVFHLSVQLFLGVCNGFISFCFERAVFLFLKDLEPFLMPSCMPLVLPKSVASRIFFQTKSRWRNVAGVEISLSLSILQNADIAEEWIPNKERLYFIFNYF